MVLWNSKAFFENKTERNTDYKVINKHDPIPYNEDPDDPEVKPGTITVTKVWEDDNNRDGLRADVKVTLVGKAGETTTINDIETSGNIFIRFEELSYKQNRDISSEDFTDNSETTKCFEQRGNEQKQEYYSNSKK